VVASGAGVIGDEVTQVDDADDVVERGTVNDGRA
jgi:hypothetical protein